MSQQYIWTGWDWGVVWARSVMKFIMVLSHVIRMQCQMRLMRCRGLLLRYSADLTIDHPTSSDGPDLCVSGWPFSHTGWDYGAVAPTRPEKWMGFWSLLTTTVPLYTSDPHNKYLSLLCCMLSRGSKSWNSAQVAHIMTWPWRIHAGTEQGIHLSAIPNVLYGDMKQHLSRFTHITPYPIVMNPFSPYNLSCTAGVRLLDTY